MKDFITAKERVDFSYIKQLTGVSMRQIIVDVMGFMFLLGMTYLSLYTIGGY